MDQRPLARFLSDRRARLRHTDVGLPHYGPRRLPGLRREEVARLAHISVSYYTRLEQARAARPSSHVIDSLSRALRLDDDERTLLFTLSGRTPDGHSVQPRRDVAPNILALIDRLPDTAALVLDAKFDLLAWNDLTVALFEDFSAVPPADRNLIKAFFLEPEPSRRHHGVEGGSDFARFAVSQLRAATARYPRDGDLRALTDELRSRSVEFDALWQRADVIVPRHLVKTMIHPTVGPIAMHCDLLTVPDRDQLIVLFTVDPGTPSHHAFASLGVPDTQNMTLVGEERSQFESYDD